MADGKPVTKAKGARRAPTAPSFPPLYLALVLLALAAPLVGSVVFFWIFDDGGPFWSTVLGVGMGLFAMAPVAAWLSWLLIGPERGKRIAHPSNLQSALAPTLAELEAARLQAGRSIRRRAAWMTPVGVAAGLALFLIVVHEESLWMLFALGGGAAVGHGLAVFTPSGVYDRLYKRRVLPQLAGLFGALTYARPPRPDLERLRRFHVFRHFTFVRADDAIVGEYRGLKVSIVQLYLTRLKFLVPKEVFRGLVIEIGLKNRLTGTTAVAADAGAFGNLADELAARNIRRVGLESPAFEREYEVYATDQVMARALLTPDFMERFMALGRLSGFERPLALAQDSVLLLAMPRSVGYGDFFAPPDYDKPAADDDTLQKLYHDIEAMLRAADAAIALDNATRLQSTPPPDRVEPTLHG